jgi:hypothetical protein
MAEVLPCQALGYGIVGFEDKRTYSQEIQNTAYYRSYAMMALTKITVIDLSVTRHIDAKDREMKGFTKGGQGHCF